MSERVCKLKDAKKHFNKYDYSILCVKGKAEFMAKTYYEAEKFFQACTKGPENELMFQIEEIEKTIKKRVFSLNSIQYIIQNQLAVILRMQPDFIESTTKKLNKEILELEEKINDIVKEHPEIEHYYILHKLIK